MAISRVKLFAPEIVDNAAPDDLITVPATPATNLLVNGRVRFVNYSGAPATITAWAVPSGGTAGNDNICLPVTSINNGAFLDMDVPQLEAGGKLQAQAGTATAITAQAMDGSYYS
jgi:hypothetical protein